MKSTHSRLIVLAMCLFTIATLQAQFVGPAPLVVPGDNYAFAYSPNGTIGSLSQFGLYFNETSASTPGYEFKGSSGSKLVTIQSIPKSNREPGDITFGATGSLIVNPNRYAFRFSLTNTYGLFFNAAGFAYEFRTADASPVFSIGANSGDLHADGTITASGYHSSGKVVIIDSSIVWQSSLAPLRVVTPSGGGWGISHSDGTAEIGTYVGDCYNQGTYGGWLGTNTPHPLYLYTRDSCVTLTVDTTTRVGIGHTDPIGKLHVQQDDGLYAGYFTADSLSSLTQVIRAEYTADSVAVDARAIYAECTPINYYGLGIEARASYIGVIGQALDDGSSFVYNTGIVGVSDGNSQEGAFSTHVGVYGGAFSFGADSTLTNYGILGEVSFGTGTNYAGYFAGDVAVTGTFSNPSDAQLKTNVASVKNAVELMSALNVHQYEFDLEKYGFMNLPEGKQYGLIAQDVEQVLPELVKRNVHAASDPKATDRPQHDRVEYKSVNYLGLIPLLVQAVNEQTELIEEKDEAIELLKETVMAQDSRIAGLEDQFNQLEQALSSCCLGQKTGQSMHQQIPESKEPWLGQNVPNPFDRSTTIQYYIPENAEHAVIKVFTLEGKEVQAYELASGYGEVTFRAMAASGSLLYSLIIDGQVVSSRRMIAQ